MAESIRYYRKKIGLRQLDLGQRLGVSAQAVSKWELGKAEPDYESIQKMCQLFGINSDTLLGLESHISIKEITESLYQPDPNKITATLSPSEQSLLTVYRTLNPQGQGEVNKYADYCATKPEYQKDTLSKTV